MNSASAGHAARPTRDEAIARAAEIVGHAWAELAQAYAEGGAEAVGRLPREPGELTDEQAAALYESWVQEARQQRDAGAPAAESPPDAGRG